MRIRIGIYGYLTAAALLCFAAGVFAQTGPLTNPSSNSLEERTMGVASARHADVLGQAAQRPASPKPKSHQALTVAVPESPGPLLLAADLLALGTLFIVFKRRLIRSYIRTNPDRSSRGM